MNTGFIWFCIMVVGIALTVAAIVIQENNREARKHGRELAKQAQKDSKLRQAYSLTNGMVPSVNKDGDILINYI